MTSSKEPGSESIRFLLDGRVHHVGTVDPNTTLLEYLREGLGRTGTKEGCAEGDCGACTVVVGELVEDPEGERVRYRAVNACIRLLATLDGRELVTVESLAAADGTLHPSQQAMVDSHASQCGFCTPGFVMSLFALHCQGGAPSRTELADALAGNLCRCTGYRPILDAAESMFERPAPEADDQSSRARLRSIQRTEPLVLGGERDYYAPRNADELARLFVERPDAHLLAGGTDLGLWITKELRDLDAIIFLGEVEELAAIEETESEITMGATVTLTDATERLAANFESFGELIRRFASPPIRNAATLVGNIANGSPIGDSMPALLAVDAELELRRADRVRRLPLHEFYLGYRRTALEPGEFIQRVRIPKTADDDLFRTYKVSKRFDQDISAVCGAFRLRMEDGRIDQARVAFGGMAAIPQRAGRCEDALAGADWSEETVRSAMAALDEDFQPIDDMRASAEYRRTVARNLLRRLYLETRTPQPNLSVLGR